MKRCVRFLVAASIIFLTGAFVPARAQTLLESRMSPPELGRLGPAVTQAPSFRRPYASATPPFSSCAGPPDKSFRISWRAQPPRVSLDPAEHHPAFSFCGTAPSGAAALPDLEAPLKLPPISPCLPSLASDASLSCLPERSWAYRSWISVLDAPSSGSILAVQPRHEEFHWAPALWQSFEFLVLEHTWRLAWDPYARYLLFHKPFWRDYLASAGHFDMSRWGDGDDFLVNYIGHPLEGSVSGNIFLQNDPQGRSATFGTSRAYWVSRLKAMGWAAAYSAYFEIGPVLSEAALGNEGGYTYVPDCGFYPTCDKEPGERYKPPTNNTGWVDFVVTPVIGTGWIVLEDAIETQIVDRVAAGRPNLKYKVLRAALTPSRTMSNFLSGKRPWYRYKPKDAAIAAFADPFERLSERLEARPDWMDHPRWAAGLQFISLDLPMDWEGCSACRVFVPGVGLNLSYRASRLLSFDSEFNLFPGTGSEGERGGAQEVLAGLKIGRPLGSWGVFSQIRPGFIHYDKTLVPGTSADYDSTTRFALDLSGGVEYYTSRRSAIRFNLGTTLVHYLTGHPDPNQPPASVLSSDYYATQGSFHVTSGYVFRF